MTASVGALRITLGANTAQFESGMRRAQATARSSGQSIEGSFAQMRARTAQAFSGMRSAAAAFGLVLGAVAIVQFARHSLDLASSLSETARSVGLNVEQLQILRRAAIENGASIEGMERAVSILNRTLGQARAGVPAAVQAFHALRIDPQQFTKAGDVLPRVMESIRNLRTESEQAAAAQRLMGRGAAEMIPFLIQGAAGYNRMAQAAHEAGLLTQEQADRADEAKDKIDLLAESLRVRLAIAIADNIGPISAFASWLGSLASGANTAADQVSHLARNLSIVGAIMGGRMGGLWGAGAGFVAGNVLGGRMAAASDDANMNLGFRRQQLFAAQRELAARRAASAPGSIISVRRATGARSGGTIESAQAELRRQIGLAHTAAAAARAGIHRPVVPTDTGASDLDLSPSGSPHRARADHTAEQAARRRHDVESELNRARQEELRAQLDVTSSASGRAEINQMISYLEQGQSEADRRLSVLLKDRTQAESDSLADIQTRTFHIQRQAMDEAEAQRLADARVEVSKGLLENERDMESASGDLADTVAERRASQLRLLDIAERQEIIELEAVKVSKDSTEAQKEIARARLGMLGALYQNRRQGVLNQTRGPLGDYLASLPTTAARAREALEGVAVNGLQAITDGLTEAISGTRKWGDVFKSVAQSIIADLIRIQIQQRLIPLLSNALNSIGGFGSGGGSSLGSLQGANSSLAAFGGLFGNLPGRAAGGPVLPGRMYMVGERGPEPLLMGSQGGTIIPNGAAGGITINQHFAPSFAGNAPTREEMLFLAGRVKTDTLAAVRQIARRSR